MTATDVGDARAVTERHATTFALATRLLEPDVRDDVYLLYSVFRTLDDLVDDGAPDAAQRVAAVDGWAATAATRGSAATTPSLSSSPEVDTLALLADRHPIPPGAVADFCAGMRHDLRGDRIATDGELDRYCYRVAGTVGVVMASVLGVSSPRDALPAAASLGMAMQRTNILRDIDEDEAAGRVYVSEESRRRSGGSLAPGARAALLREQIARADELYEEGLAGVRCLRRGRVAVVYAASLYREILREIERRGLGREPGRAVVGRRRKLAVIARATLSGR